MNWLSVVKALLPVAASIAQTAHPTPGSGPSRLETATKIIQQGLQVVATIGAITHADAQQNKAVIQEQINAHVAEQKAAGGVPKLPA